MNEAIRQIVGRIILLIFLFVVLLLSQPAPAQKLDRYSFSSNQMGTQFNITLYSEDDSLAKKAADSAFERVKDLNQIMSDYLEESELNRLSRTFGSGEEVKVSRELFEVLKESIRISEMTRGLFDVTIGPLSKFWRVVRMSPDPQLPNDEELSELQGKVGYQYIKLDEENQTAELLKSGMQLDLGGIAKGYAAEEALKVLHDYGIYRALIDAGGDVTLGDPPPGRETWDVAVPKNTQKDEQGYITLKASGKSVATSGDLFQFVIIDGQRYSHVLNPLTGLGAADQIQATVVAPAGMRADALASVLTLMEPEEGLKFINELKNTEAIIFRNMNGNIREWKSAGIDNFMK